MAGGDGSTPRWDHTNEQEQMIILFCPLYKNLLTQNRPDLTRIVQPGPLWSYLRKYEVIDTEIEEKLKLNATNPEMVERLLDLLEVGPSWRLHAFLKACKETKQQHVIQLLGLDPASYDDDQPDNTKPLFNPPLAKDTQEPTSGDDPASNATNSDVKEIIKTLGDYVDTLKTRYNLKPPSENTEHRTEPSLRYNMNYKRTGVALIFNMGEFKRETHMSSRTGYKIDGDLMKGTFEQLGFEEYYYVNLTTKEMLKAIDKVAGGDYADTACFACIISTHGDGDMIFATDGAIAMDSIVTRFNNTCHPTWTGKPKLFFIQASRGDKLDPGQELVVEDGQGEEGTSSCTQTSLIGVGTSPKPLQAPTPPSDSGTSKHPVKIPLEADILLSWSTAPGYFSFRNTGYGSVYIRYLAKALVTYGFEEDILTILTRVNHMVAFEFQGQSVQPLINGKKQMPEFTSRLTKQLFFPKPPKKT